MGNKGEKVAASKKSVYVDMIFSRFALPPVRDALVIGKKARIGRHAIEKAFNDLTPGMFKMVHIDHSVIEGLLIRRSILRKIDEESIIRHIRKHSEQIMDETDTLRVEINLEVVIKEMIEMPV